MSGLGDRVDGIAEVFRCFICMEWPEDACLCPHCSKLCCFLCIKRWLTEQRPICPHCRCSLLVHELVKCRWADDVYQQVRADATRHPRQDPASDKERCKLHKEELSVYCATCSQCICHKCALFGGEHGSHKFEEMDKIYSLHKGFAQTEKSKLWKRFLEVNELAKKVERSMDHVKAEKQEQSRLIQENFDNIINRLETQLKTKLQKLAENRNVLNRKAEDIKGVMNELDKVVKNTTKSEVISKGHETQKKLKPLIQQVQQTTSTQDFENLPIIEPFTNELVPTYDTSTFKIKHFSRYRHRGEAVYSSTLKVQGLTWRLKVYPYGNVQTEGNFLSVFLELTKGFSKTAQYQYSIEMLYQGGRDESKNVVREFTSDYAVGECWGYHRFYRLDLLAAEGYIDQTADTLILKYGVRAPTYYHKCRDMMMYCHDLKKENSMLSHSVSQLKEGYCKAVGIKKGEVVVTQPHHHHQSQSVVAEDDHDRHRGAVNSSHTHAKSTASSRKASNGKENDTRSKPTDDPPRAVKAPGAGSESLSQEHYSAYTHDPKTAADGELSTLSLPHTRPSSHHGHEKSTVHKTKQQKEPQNRHRHKDAATNSGSGPKNDSSVLMERGLSPSSLNISRQDRESTPLVTTSGNPQIVVGSESDDDGELSSPNSTPVPKPDYHNSFEGVNLSPAISTSTLSTISVRLPEFNGHVVEEDARHSRHLAKPTAAPDDGGAKSKESKQRSAHTRQQPLLTHEKHKSRNSGEFQSLKEMEMYCNGTNASAKRTYEFNASPANAYDLSQVDNYSHYPLKVVAQDSPPSPRNFLSQSVMDINGQDEEVTLSFSRTNLSRMASEPHLGPPGLQNSMCAAMHKPKYTSHVGHSNSFYLQGHGGGGRQGNRSKQMKSHQPSRRHSGDNNVLTSSGMLSQTRKGDEV